MHIETPHPGIETWVNQHGITIFRLHYSADPVKTPEWAEKQKAAMTDPAMFQQEYEIDFSAKLGTLLYQLESEATLEPSFPIPADWTRYFALDPHPMVPHACLWLAMDPWNDGWIYRELWPSRIYGKPGNVPEDDSRYTIAEYVETALWLESKDNPENDKCGKDGEEIFKRVIDYAARAFGKGTSDDPEQPNFQKRFEDAGLYPFEDAVKDHDTGIACVNEWLKPRDVEQPDGTFKPKSRLHIFEDKCPELIYQLRNNRFQQLTPLMAERMDPTGKPVAKRNHLTDGLRYLCMAKPEYIVKRKLKSTVKPLAQLS